MSKENLIEFGSCGKPHGIKGGFSFKLYNTEDSILKKGMSLYLFPQNSSSSIDTKGELYKIKSISIGHKVMAYLEGVEDRNLVEAMVPFIIKVDRSEFPESADGEVYLEDLVGLDVIDFNTKEKIGSVKSFYDNTAQDILIIKTSSKNIELPLIENFVPVIDMEAKLIEVIIPEYIE